MIETLDAEVNLDVKGNHDDPAIATYLNLIADNHEKKLQHDAEIEAIQQLFDKAFEIREPKGTRRISSKLLYQAIWRTANRMKPLDFTIHGKSRPKEIESIVRDGVSTMMDVGGYDSCLRDKMGVFWNLLMYGDGLFMMGEDPDEDSEVPFLYQPVSLTNVYVDMNAVGMRAGKRSVRRMVLIFSYDWNDFVNEYPDFADVAGPGDIPRNRTILKELEETEEQERNQKDTIEIAFGWDLNTKNCTIFAGAEATLIEKKEGEDYPNMLNGKPYIPVFDFLCIPSSQGFFNKGIGHIVYDLAIVTSQLMNKMVAHIDENVHPVEFVNMPHAEASRFFQKLTTAYEMRAKGLRPFIPIEYDPANPQASQVSAQTLVTQDLTSQAQVIFDMLIRELTRMGINVDELDPGRERLATEVLSDEENANAFVKQMMEYNASESQFVVEATMQFIREYISSDNEKMINSVIKIPVEQKRTVPGPDGQPVVQTVQQEVEFEGLTYGMLSRELKEHEYFAKMNSRTGSIPSNALQQLRIGRLLPLAAPGSKAQVRLLQEFARMNDYDIPGMDFFPEGQGQQINPQTANDAVQPIPTDTSRQGFNPRQKDQMVAF